MCQSGDTGEIAKATGKGIDAAREFGKFLSRFVSGPLEQVSGIWEDKLLYRRLENQVRLRQRFDQVLRERGLSEPTRPIPLKIIFPLLQAASIEDDEPLQELWVNLLANSADADSGVEMRRVFIDILSTFTTLDALLFHLIYSIPHHSQDSQIWTLYLPEKVVLDEPHVENYRPLPHIELSLQNLLRNNCLNTAVAWGGIQSASIVIQTVMGRHLHQALSRTRFEQTPVGDDQSGTTA
jgi:hypothetical protein